MTIGYIQEPVRNESLTVTTANKILAEARQAGAPRKVIIIRNISSAAADIITVNFGLAQATANAGIVLNQGESVQDSSEAGYDCFQGVITAKCATANGVVAIMER